MSTRRILAALAIALPAAAGAWACNGGSPAAPADAGVDGSSSSSGSSSGGDMPAACSIDAGGEPLASSPASGTFTGPDVGGFICAGGAFAYLEKTQASSAVGSQFLMIIDSSFTGDPSTRMQFQTPANATSGELTIMSGVSAAAPGTYGTSAGACGGVAFCVSLPVPAGVQCSGTSNCAPGCELQGPVGSPMCVPSTPRNCYLAQAASDCVSGTQTPKGSWTLTLVSVQPYDGEGGAAPGRYVVHGSFTTTMVGDGDAGGASATLAVNF